MVVLSCKDFSEVRPSTAPACPPVPVWDPSAAHKLKALRVCPALEHIIPLCVPYMNALSGMQIVEFLNFLYCVGMFLEFAAFISLRFTQPDLPRPYR